MNAWNLKGDQPGFSCLHPLLPCGQPVWLRCHPHWHSLWQRGYPGSDATWVGNGKRMILSKFCKGWNKHFIYQTLLVFPTKVDCLCLSGNDTILSPKNCSKQPELKMDFSISHWIVLSLRCGLAGVRRITLVGKFSNGLIRTNTIILGKSLIVRQTFSPSLIQNKKSQIQSNRQV